MSESEAQADARPEWAKQLWRIAFYFAVIAATVALSSIIAYRVHPS